MKTTLLSTDMILSLAVTVEVSDVPDLFDPITRRTLAPSQVRIDLRRADDRNRAHVTVLGPRRLKSGELGQPITSIGWERTAIESLFSQPTERPTWLTNLLAEYLPGGWSTTLVGIPLYDGEVR
ncbi:hypothetical protein [Streptomyces sp. NPDC088674]|uniref:hypothetical protein n=1 Tax=Streptomyces sp. NPDC088674 TaxID=3365869 RepID=UPI0038016279